MKLFALYQLKPEDLKAFVYGNDPVKNCVGLVDIEYHFSEDNLKGVKFRERARALNKLPYLLGYKRVKIKTRLATMNL